MQEKSIAKPPVVEVVKGEKSGLYQAYIHALKTTEEQRQRLKHAGFVHVTGLPVYANAAADEPIYVVGENLTEKDFGSFSTNNSMSVLVTDGGEIWLRYNIFELVEICLSEFGATREKGVFVPCSNREVLNFKDVMARLANPDVMCVFKKPTG